MSLPSWAAHPQPNSMQGTAGCGPPQPVSSTPVTHWLPPAWVPTCRVTVTHSQSQIVPKMCVLHCPTLSWAAHVLEVCFHCKGSICNSCSFTERYKAVTDSQALGYIPACSQSCGSAPLSKPDLKSPTVSQGQAHNLHQSETRPWAPTIPAFSEPSQATLLWEAYSLPLQILLLYVSAATVGSLLCMS